MLAVGAYSATSVRNASSLKISKHRSREAPAVAKRIGVELDRHVRPDARELAALPRRLDVGEQRFAIALLRDLRGVRDQVLERSVLGDQLARAFVADARARP